jgi:hypothetical protein
VVVGAAGAAGTADGGGAGIGAAVFQFWSGVVGSCSHESFDAKLSVRSVTMDRGGWCVRDSAGA